MPLEMKFNPPYPTFGRQLQLIARVLDTANDKDIQKKLEHLAHDSSINLDTLLDVKERVIQLPFCYPNKSGTMGATKTYNICEEFVKQLSEQFFELNISAINSLPAETFPSKEELNKSFIPFIGCVLVPFIADLFPDDVETGKKLLLSDKPLITGFKIVSHTIPNFIDGFKTAERDKVQRWIKGEQYPGMQGLFSTLDTASSHLGNNYIRCCEILFAANVLQKIAEITEPIYKLPTFFKKLFDGTSKEDFKRDDIHIGKLLILRKHFIHAQDGIKFRASQNPSTFVTVLHQFANVCALLQINSMAVEWRYNVLVALALTYEGHFKKALDVFKQVMPNLFYTTDIIHEAFFIMDIDQKTGCSLYNIALALAAVCKDRPFQKTLKTYGVLFGLFGKPTEAIKESFDTIPPVNKESRTKDITREDWEEQHWANRFFEFFPENLVKNIDSIKHMKTNVNMPLFFTEDEMPKQPVKPYSKAFSIRWKTFPQLVWFAQTVDATAIKTLLEANVKDNKLTTSSESALLFSIEAMVPYNTPFNPEKGKEIFDLLVKHHIDDSGRYAYDSKIVNTPTNKKKLTCLGQAVLSGNAEVVENLLKMGASVDALQSTDQQSPLYKMVQWSKGYPDKNILESMPLTPDNLDGMRRGNEFFQGKTNEEIIQMRNKIFQNENFMEISSCIRELHKKLFEEHLPPERTLEIAEILLKWKADPNKKHNRNGIIGYTPLMLAAELNSLEMFKLLLKYGGNPNQEAEFTFGNPRYADCWGIARYWKSNSILQFLYENREKYKIKVF
ncbi:MAG: hypothetical protein MJZ10_10300 [Fibrobacter sp.]|nr:hypothetical protein [Fibrobacter sp.]